MTLIADILMIAGALGAAFYCYVLSRRLAKLADLEGGVGGAVSTLSAQVTEMTAALTHAQAAARQSSRSLSDATERAEAAAKRLELLIASLHDLPQETPSTANANGQEQADASPTFLRSPRINGSGRRP